MNYQRYLWLDAGAGHTQIADVQGLSDFVGDEAEFQFDIYERITSGTSGSDAWSSSITDTYTTSRYGDDLQLRLGANSASGGDGETKNGIKIESLQAGRQFRREVPGSTAISNDMTFTTYNYTLGDYQVLASGTVSYMAIDSGGPVYSEKASVSGTQEWTSALDAISAPYLVNEGHNLIGGGMTVASECYGCIKLTENQVDFYQTLDIEADMPPTYSGIDIYAYGYDSNFEIVGDDVYGGEGSGDTLYTGGYLILTDPHYLVIYNDYYEDVNYLINLYEAV
jgi:hypothetical protein